MHKVSAYINTVCPSLNYPSTKLNCLESASGRRLLISQAYQHTAILQKRERRVDTLQTPRNI